MSTSSESRFAGWMYSLSAFEPPALLKIDVQGYEEHVLAGATNVLAAVSLIECEVSIARLYEGQPSFRQMIDRLDDLGFEISTSIHFSMTAAMVACSRWMRCFPHLGISMVCDTVGAVDRRLETGRQRQGVHCRNERMRLGCPPESLSRGSEDMRHFGGRKGTCGSGNRSYGYASLRAAN